MLSTTNISPATKVRLIQATYILLGVFILSLTAQMNIPLKPVPITLQSFGVMLLALTFDRKSAIKSVLVYLTLGAIGVPVFANFRSGITVLLGITGGYLFGFLVAVVVMTSLKNLSDKNNFFHIVLNCLVGTLIICLSGILQLSVFVGFKEAIHLGLIPFIIPGLIKATVLSILVRYVKIA
jgi:biotin transport system substrate-specific component